MTPAQLAALEHVRHHAERERTVAERRVRLALERDDAYGDPAVYVSSIWHRARVALHFHPDRLARDGRSVAAGLLASGIYRSQFETGISNGSRSAFPGGERDQWEDTCFGGAYHRGPVEVAERPKYGALNVMNHADGPAPRFGSCHVRLRPQVLDRCTFCFGDSHAGPHDVGTVDALESVLAAMLEAVENTGAVLGKPFDRVQSLLSALINGVPYSPTPGRSLDYYIEAQVHGDVRLAEDAEGLVADPSFRGTETGNMLAEVARQANIGLTWHAGFELPFSDVPDDFRGPAMPLLARRIEQCYAHPGERITAALIGRAAASIMTEPNRWSDWGTLDESLQHVKQMWHVLVQFGNTAVRQR